MFSSNSLVQIPHFNPRFSNSKFCLVLYTMMLSFHFSSLPSPLSMLSSWLSLSCLLSFSTAPPFLVSSSLHNLLSSRDFHAIFFTLRLGKICLSVFSVDDAKIMLRSKGPQNLPWIIQLWKFSVTSDKRRKFQFSERNTFSEHLQRHRVVSEWLQSLWLSTKQSRHLRGK